MRTNSLWDSSFLQKGHVLASMKTAHFTRLYKLSRDCSLSKLWLQYYVLVLVFHLKALSCPSSNKALVTVDAVFQVPCLHRRTESMSSSPELTWFPWVTKQGDSVFLCLLFLVHTVLLCPYAWQQRNNNNKNPKPQTNNFAVGIGYLMAGPLGAFPYQHENDMHVC